MSKLTEYSLIIVLSCLISAFSQIILKRSAGKKYSSRLREYLNLPVITAYAVFFLSSLMTMYGLKVVPLKMSPILESTGYIFITVLGYIFFKERLTKKQLIGMVLVISGIIIFSLG